MRVRVRAAMMPHRIITMQACSGSAVDAGTTCTCCYHKQTERLSTWAASHSEDAPIPNLNPNPFPHRSHLEWSEKSITLRRLSLALTQTLTWGPRRASHSEDVPVVGIGLAAFSFFLSFFLSLPLILVFG